MRAKGVLLLIVGPVLVAAGLSFNGCIESRTATELRTHPTGWVDPASVDFHGTRVLAHDADSQTYVQDECLVCHREAGPGVARMPSCDECHLGPGGHPPDWMTESSPNFHGEAVAARGDQPCAACHGADFRGGAVGVSCYTCHAGGPSGHPAGWVDRRAATFHGRRVEQQGDRECRRCHGGNLDGGWSGVACSQCHDDEGDD